MSHRVSTARAADVLLRAMGGATVMLRVPAVAVAADVTEQLGIAKPGFQDVPIGPVVSRKARAMVTEGEAAKWDLLVSATAVEAVLGSLDFASASVLFANAYGVIAADNGELLEIVSASQEPVVGEAYVYRLVVKAALARLV